ncbi:MAG: murein transglycosylase [Desulfobacterales bacterium]|nr:murein transglycosylase [Desulfobacterales bacterium]
MLINISGCALKTVTRTKPLDRSEAPPMMLIPPGQYPVFTDDIHFDGLEQSIYKSISYLKRVPPDRKFIFGKDTYNSTHMIKSLEFFSRFIQKKPSKSALKKFVESKYLVYRSTGKDNNSQVLYTGYYEPFLKGSLYKSPLYKYPVYPIPEDRLTIDLSLFSDKFKGEKKIIGRYSGNKTIVPYYNRKEIESGNLLENSAKPIAWVKDRIDLFFLEIQGSGKIYLNNGKLINVHYHASNGHRYRAIGKLLLDEGKILRSEMSMQRIKTYLKNHPDEVRRILNYNPSYIFFKLEEDGPIGCLNVKLTPGRSVATDRRIFPAGALAFIETKKPIVDGDEKIHSWADFGRFVLNQDTGGAITGPGRADIFWGNGEYAEIAAGYMQHTGRLYFLILKPDTKL